MKKYDVVIAGAGLAGLSAALELSRANAQVLLIDKAQFPREKLCGGFLGPENIAFLEDFDLLEPLLLRGANRVNAVSLTSSKGASITTNLNNHALAMSRKLLDKVLLEKVIELGTEFRDQSRLVSYSTEIELQSGNSLKRETVSADHLIISTGGAFHNRKPPEWVGFYALFEGGTLPEKEVVLHFAEKAHVGLNHFEDQKLNVCGVVHRSRLDQVKGNLDDLLKILHSENSKLRKHLKGSERISSWRGIVLDFSRAQLIQKEAFFAGDAAGMVDPVVGGGMSMAIATGSFLGRLLKRNLEGRLTLKETQKLYVRYWEKNFRVKSALSLILGKLAHQSQLTEFFLKNASRFPQAFERVFNYHHPKSNRIIKKAVFPLEV